MGNYYNISYTTNEKEDYKVRLCHCGYLPGFVENDAGGYNHCWLKCHCCGASTYDAGGFDYAHERSPKEAREEAVHQWNAKSLEVPASKRYWVADGGIFVREWSRTEYQQHDPETPIIEEIKWYVCSRCGRTLNNIATEDSFQNTWIGPRLKDKITCIKCPLATVYYNPLDKLRGFKKIPTKMRCFELKELEVDGKFITYQIYH